MTLAWIRRGRALALHNIPMPVVSTIAGAARPMSLRSGPAIATVISLAALTLGLVPASAGAHAARSSGVGVPCSTAALIKAIDNANMSPTKATTLDLAHRCTYRLTSPFNDGPNGLPVIASQQLTINGNDAVIKRVASAPPFRILNVGDGGQLTLSHVTITGGDSSNGAGILNDVDGTLSLSSVRITGNTGRGEDASGGGITNRGTATVTDSMVSSNTETVMRTADGGGIYNEGDMTLFDSRVSDNVLRGGTQAEGGGIDSFDAKLTMMESRVSGNSATATDFVLGAGIDSAGPMGVQSSQIDDNTATAIGPGGQVSGGGIVSAFADIPASAILRSIEAEGNVVRCSGVGCGALAGGIYNIGLMTLTDHSLVSKNTVTATGANGQARAGGIFNGSASALFADDSLVSKNTVTATGANGQAHGAGIFNHRATSVLDNSDVSKNTATASGQGGQALGGGIANDDQATLRLRDNSDVTKDTARAPRGTANGGGIFNDASSQVTIINSVVEKNKTNNCGGPGTPIAGCTG